ncbi:MAG: putative SirA-like protein [Actinomycetia bacterium]|nr:putative SirA-like protein [Actinomycetes bacterium]
MIELDCRGLKCPLPVITLARRIAEAEPGETVRVLADDPAARADIPAWCRMKNHDYLGEPEPGTYEIRKKSS